MLVLLPASDGKADVRRGAPFDEAALSFPALGPTRRAVLAASDEPITAGVPTARAEAVYTGVVYRALAVATLDPASRRRARRWIVAVSPLWGAVRLGDRVPTDHVDMCARPPGLGHLPQVWQAPLAAVLPDAARRGLVVDCRTAAHLTAWRPQGELAERTVAIRITRDRHHDRGAPAHHSKRTQGEVVRRIVVEGLDPTSPVDLANALGAWFDVDLRPPSRPGRRWELAVVATAGTDAPARRGAP